MGKRGDWEGGNAAPLGWERRRVREPKEPTNAAPLGWETAPRSGTGIFP
ncbi:MAG: hypothetical protein J6K20_11350 [Thermoguttaceae bacterium]|nr:hypothetical protein [Thermoguttaceae bacterium]